MALWSVGILIPLTLEERPEQHLISSDILCTALHVFLSNFFDPFHILNFTLSQHFSLYPLVSTTLPSITISLPYTPLTLVYKHVLLPRKIMESLSVCVWHQLLHMKFRLNSLANNVRRFKHSASLLRRSPLSNIPLSNSPHALQEGTNKLLLYILKWLCAPSLGEDKPQPAS